MLPFRTLSRMNKVRHGQLHKTFCIKNTASCQQILSCSLSSSKVPDFDVFQATGPEAAKNPVQQSTAAIVFGFAGSPKAQAEKIANVYTSKGHQAFYCVLPQLVTFTYDMEKIRNCAEHVIQVLKENGVERVVTHSLSNNGSILYQQFVHLVKQQEGLVIEGAVFDSAPGPLGWQNVQKYLRLEKFDLGIEKWSPKWQSPFFLPFHLVGVDLANRKPLSEALSNFVFQLRCLIPTFF